ncbi:metallophosphoesterase [Halorubellus sp. PRR65]|uniref:metallophosphoesterase n=1 Tax=Halorubellus sp. PRR65 TaxID=3098148 RepID=UPI002B257B96|nr:metallophosphoesterase [Halorubellus sp. PRR65]
MTAVEPVPGEPAAVVDADGRRVLAVADVHAGIESALRDERGVNLDSNADERRERLQALVADTAATELVVVGDLMHSIGGPGGAERGEIEVLVESIGVPVTVVKGNHDGDLGEWAAVDVTDATGVRIGDVGFAHGHTWPAPDVLRADVVCVGHEHPQVRLTDEVGGRRVERVWLRGGLDPAAFTDRYEADELPDATAAGDLVVFPAFNDRAGGTWTNVDGRGFLSPFLPDALRDGQAYLLDGTRLGRYDHI